MGILDRIQYRNFCYCCTLQSGVIMSVVVFSTIFIGMIIMTAYAVTVLNGWTFENVCGLCLAYGHALLVIFGISLSFYGAYKEDFRLISCAAFIITIATLLFIAASILSYIPNVYFYSCVVHRCPDHIWMQDSYWRNYYFEGMSHVYISNRPLGMPGDYDADPALDEDGDEYVESESGEQYYYGRLQIAKRKRKSLTLSTPRLTENEEKSTNPALREDFDFKSHKATNALLGQNNTHPDNNLDQSKLKSGRLNLTTKRTHEAVIPGHNHKLRHFQDDDERTHLLIRYPAFGLALSVLFNLGYMVFLVYIVLVYIAYSNELKGGIPGGFTKESWTELKQERN